MSRDEIEKIQSEELVGVVSRVYHNVPFYRAKMQAIGLEPGDIHGLADLEKLPMTTKQDLRDTYPYGMFSAPLDDIVRIHASSGTTGKQTVVGYTRKDVDIWSECMARSLSSGGAGRDSIVQVSYGYGLFTGGLGAHYGAERIGASVIPTSSGNTQRQIQIIRDFGSTHICCTPSYALYIGDTMREMGVHKSEIRLKAGFFGAEPWTENMRREIEERLGLHALDIYGLSEVMGPSVSCECLEQSGMHVWEDHFIPEIINPETLETMAPGANGEILFTTITKEGMPLIRYRTRDVSSLNYERCPCGRTHVRMTRITGRTDDMLIIRGVNVFPSQIESVLLEFGDAAPHYQIIVDRSDNLDEIEVQVEMTPQMFSDEIKNIERTERKIMSALHSVLGLAAKVRLVEPKTIARSEGKAKRVIDNRVLK
jgi:phenylacetate-CoA ligase